MEILGWIIAIVSGLCITGVVLYIAATCIYLKKEKNISKKTLKKRINRIFLAFIILALLCISITGTIIELMNLHVYPHVSDKGDEKNEEDVRNEEYMAQYTLIVEKLPFHDEVINEEKAIWEDLIYEYLLYNEYLENDKVASGFDELRNLYMGATNGIHDLSSVTVEKILEYVDLAYGSEILPDTDKSLEEIEAQILPLEKRLNTDVKVFQNEFAVRALDCSALSSDECFYQAGRAADDAFKVLLNKPEPPMKQLKFYGSMAVVFYLISVKYNEGNIDLPFVYYRIAEIFIYLEENVDFGEDDDTVHTHCLLMAEVFLILAEKEYKAVSGTDDIHKDLTFFSCYYAEVTYEFIAMYKSADVELKLECQIHASQYYASPYSEKYPKCRKSCNDILDNLDDK